jgi:hypothetical protein
MIGDGFCPNRGGLMGCVSGVSSVSLASSESVSATLRLESTEESDPQRNELLEMDSQH